MSPKTARRIVVLTTQLAETLMTAALCAEEIRAAVLAELDGEGPLLIDRPGGLSPPRSNGHQRPILDESTMSVVWKNRTLRLGHTREFRFLGRLARRPNQYVTHLDLLEEVWDGEDREISTIRSLVRRLRNKLKRGGMDDLADAIQGYNGRYILNL
jgi:DNA-binding response OmpR family regulator